MDIKNLFKEPTRLVNETPEEIIKEVESIDYAKEKIDKDRSFIPDVDLSDPKNFARFGSAQEYYNKIFQYVSTTYPFDGSHKEVLEWEKNLTYLEKYVVDNQYPRSTGYISLNGTNQCISIRSGPNARTDPYRNGNILDKSVGREANLGMTPDSGNTVEFWIKYTGDDNDVYRAIYHSKNAKIEFSVQYNHHTEKLKTIYNHDTVSNTVEFDLGLPFGGWKHIAVTCKNIQAELNVKLYVDGELSGESIFGDSINEADVNNIDLIGYIGCNGVDQGSYLKASIDEFRYWKIERSHKDIKRDRFDRVYGGTDTDLANTELGVYYRFNEGVINNSIYDSKVIDYSGRSTDGLIVGYSAGVRSTNSAIDELDIFEHKEIADLIINTENPLVKEKYIELDQLGQEWDNTNSTSILKTLPSWIVDEDESGGTNQLKYLTQIIASYFDKLYLEVDALPKLAYSEYSQQDRKVAPFMNNILGSLGIDTPDIFIDATLIEQFRDRDERLLFEDNISNLKNLIYKNIYNNLIYIFKSKGTEKAFRNLIRSYGVDDELIKINLYANNTDFELRNNKRSTVEAKRVLDLSTPDTCATSIITEQAEHIHPTCHTLTPPFPTFIVPTTLEVQVAFPKKPEVNEPGYNSPEDTEISLFGMASVPNGAYTETGDFNFDVSFIKNSKDSKGGYFKFVVNNETLESNNYLNVYDGERWNFAIRLKTPQFDNNAFDLTNADVINGIMASNGFSFELYGINVESNVVIKEFTLETQVPLTGQDITNYHSAFKHIYLGAKKQDFTGVLEKETDAQFVNARFWFEYLSNEDLIEHAKDVTNYGISNPNKKPYEKFGEKLKRSDALAMHWNFDTLSNNNIIDIKGLNGNSSNVSVNFQTNLTNHDGVIDGYSDSEILKKIHLAVSVPQIPENLFSNSTVNVPTLRDPVGETDYQFTRETRPTSFFMSFEKSMYQSISEDMLDMFAGILDFNTLIGDPLNNYRIINRDLQALRNIFFQKVQELATLEKYIEYYKWIDSSLGYFLNQLVPASINSSGKIRNMVEDHALNVQSVTKTFANLKEAKNWNPVGLIRGVKELKYNWQSGSVGADPYADEDSKALWYKERAERLDTYRQKILDNVTDEVGLPSPELKQTKLYDFGTSYNRSPYYSRRLSRVYDVVSKTYSTNSLHQELDTFSDSVKAYSVSNISVENANNSKKVRDLFSSDPEQVKEFNLKTFNNTHPYDVVNGLTADINHKYMVHSGSEIALLKNDFLFSNTVPTDTKIIRNKYKTIITNRFSSPALGSFSPSPLSRSDDAYLDAETDSYSAGSTINFRNHAIRMGLNIDSNHTSSDTTLHKVNKNRYVNSVYEEFDNNFIQRQIPRTDYGYWWITQSAGGGAATETGGPYSSNYPNIDIKGLEILTSGNIGFDVDFLGLKDSHFTKYFNIYTGLTTASVGTQLNTFLLKQNGAYGAPSWKFTRNQNNSFVYKLRTNNLLSGVIKEPPIEWNYPVKVDIGINNINNYFAAPPVVIANLSTEYSNDIDYFANLKSSINKKDDSATGYRTLKLSDISIIQATFSELIWPRKSTVGLKENRTRPLYEYFWHDSMDNRKLDDHINMYEYATSSYSALANFTGSLLGRDSLLIKHNISKSAIKESIWPADCFSIDSTDLSSGTDIKIDYTNALIGLASPLKEYEAKYLITSASGTKYTRKLYGNYYFKYQDESRIFAKPQLIYVNHPPAVYSSDSLKPLKYEDKGLASTDPSLIYVINDGYKYENISNKTPFYDTYELFSNELRQYNRNMSIIPEFNGSDRVSNYLMDNRIGTLNKSSYLSLDGSTYKSNLSDDISLELEDEFSDDSNYKSIKLELNVLNKIRPKKGFFPIDRITQITEKFGKSYDLKSETINTSGGTQIVNGKILNNIPIDQQLLASTQPLFAPGILLNSIKASIAVDWPIVVSSSINPYVSSLRGDSGFENSKYYVLNTISKRLPFETLLNVDSITDRILYLDPTHYSTDFASGSTSNFVYPTSDIGEIKNYLSYKEYQLMMHNFLSEIPKFFLESDGFSSFVSADDNLFAQAEAGKTYAMRVRLIKPEAQQYVTDEYSKVKNDLKLKSISENYNFTTLPIESIFGPPVRYYNTFVAPTSYTSTQEMFKAVNRPAYAPYAPPYYYGSYAEAKLSFTADVTKRYSAQEIISKLKIEYINTELESNFLSGANICRNIDNNFSNENHKLSPAYLNRMTLESCINFKQIIDVQQTVNTSTGVSSQTSNGLFNSNKWSIQTRFESPMFDFSDAIKTDLVEAIGDSTFEDNQKIIATIQSRIKGLWTSYGTPVDNTNCLKIKLVDEYDKNTEESLKGLCGFASNIYDPKTGKKVIDLNTKSIGILKDNLVISEAILAIPYTDMEKTGVYADNNYARISKTIPGVSEDYIQNRYLIDRTILDRLMQADTTAFTREDYRKQINLLNIDRVNNNSILKTIKILLNYVLPPHLDWINDPNTEPFVIYAFENETMLDKQDLGDIWQNILPDSFKNSEQKTLSIEHLLHEKEFFHGMKLMPDTKLKIFKVKKKGHDNYYKLTNHSIDDHNFKYLGHPTHNWPYDYLSLAEMASLKASIIVRRF